MKTKAGKGGLARQGSSYEQHKRADRRRLFSHAQNRGTRSLRQAGIELETGAGAGNGAEALAVLQENSVDLILCDINMPDMDGLEFVKQLAGVDKAKGVPME